MPWSLAVVLRRRAATGRDLLPAPEVRSASDEPEGASLGDAACCGRGEGPFRGPRGWVGAGGPADFRLARDPAGADIQPARGRLGRGSPDGPGRRRRGAAHARRGVESGDEPPERLPLPDSPVGATSSGQAGGRSLTATEPTGSDGSAHAEPQRAYTVLARATAPTRRAPASRSSARHARSELPVVVTSSRTTTLRPATRSRFATRMEAAWMS